MLEQSARVIKFLFYVRHNLLPLIAFIGQQNLQMPPRPSSSHSQGMPTQQQSIPPPPNSNAPQMPDGSQMPPQGAMPPYQGGPGQPPPHGSMQQHGSYPKMGPYPPQSQYSQGNYSPRAQYPGYGQHPPMPPNSQSQYRPPMQNHVNPQYPPYHWAPPPQQQQQNQGGNPAVMTNHIAGPQGKNIGPPQSQSPQLQGPGTPQNKQQPSGPPNQQQQQQQGQPGPGSSPRQLNYLKQHLQHKGGYQQGGSTPPPQGFGNGPGIPHSAMGPPSHSHMGPPTSAMPPPGAPLVEGMPMHHPEDNGMQQASHQATSLITTGPDGAPLDEASQQSTLSNTSIGELMEIIILHNNQLYFFSVRRRINS